MRKINQNEVLSKRRSFNPEFAFRELSILVSPFPAIYSEGSWAHGGEGAGVCEGASV